jgi:phosphate-selective porin OprO/OprP
MLIDLTRLPALLPGAALGLAAIVAAGGAKADRLDDLQRQVDALQSELSRVKAEQGEIKKSQEEAAKKADGKAMTLKYKPGLVIESEDKNFTAHLGGRIMVDSAWYDEDKSDLGDGTEFRRARLFLAGTLFKDWEYKSQWDFADNHVGAKDVYIKYKGLKGFGNLALTLGHHKPAASLDNMTSSRFITFMERSLAHAFIDEVGDRQIGFSGKVHGDNWTAEAGIFGADVDDDPADEGNEDWQVAGRVTFAPLHEKTRVLHLGLWGSYLAPEDAGNFTFESEPESHVTDAEFVKITVPGSDSLVRWGAEAAGVYGPFALQGEYLHASVDGTDFSTDPSVDLDPDFHGWYIQGSYFLTGESRAYNAKKGKFGRVKPKNNLGEGGFGAWQVGVRYSTIDLTDEGLLGGEEDNVTLGLNWYVNPYLRFMLNTIWVDTDENATGNSANLRAGEILAGNDNPFIVQIRAQIDF